MLLPGILPFNHLYSTCLPPHNQLSHLATTIITLISTLQPPPHHLGPSLWEGGGRRELVRVVTVVVSWMWMEEDWNTNVWRGEFQEFIFITERLPDNGLQWCPAQYHKGPKLNLIYAQNLTTSSLYISPTIANKNMISDCSQFCYLDKAQSVRMDSLMIMNDSAVPYGT